MAGELELMAFKGPLQLKHLSDSIILLLYGGLRVTRSRKISDEAIVSPSREDSGWRSSFQNGRSFPQTKVHSQKMHSWFSGFSVCSVWGPREGWSGEAKHRAPTERATIMTHPESHESHEFALVLEFPHPCSGYFHLFIYKHVLSVPPMLEDEGISPHFNSFDPRPHRVVIFLSNEDVCWRYIQVWGKRDLEADKAAIPWISPCPARVSCMVWKNSDKLSWKGLTLFLHCLIDCTYGPWGKRPSAKKSLQTITLLENFFLINFSQDFSLSTSTSLYFKADSSVDLPRAVLFPAPYSVWSISTGIWLALLEMHLEAMPDTWRCLGLLCLLRFQQLNWVCGMYATDTLPTAWCRVPASCSTI